MTGRDRRQARAAKAERVRAERAERQIRRPGPRGWMGRGGGEMNVISSAPEYRGTTVQVCGLWPYSSGSGAPMIGVPLGRHLFSQATVCCDPISWFQRAKLISNPSAFILALPAMGKSTLVRRMATGLTGYGVIPMFLGDLKPDYVPLVRELDGQVISLGRGRGFLNVLDPGDAREAVALLRNSAAAEQVAADAAAAELSRLAAGDPEREVVAERLVLHSARAQRHDELAAELLQDVQARRLAMVSSLISIARREAPSDREETIIDQALKVLEREHQGVPVLGDLLKVIQDAPDDVRAVALDRGDMNRYREITDQLEASLIGLTSGGRLGETFSRQTSQRMVRDRPVVFDVSGIDEGDEQLQAAILLACWSDGFATVNVAAALADAGLEPQRHYLVVMDELHRALRVGVGLVDRLDLLTRVNREKGVGQIMITHTMRDLRSLRSEEDRKKAEGFVERSGMVIMGGLPSVEMPQLTEVVNLSQRERDLVSGWSTPGAWDEKRGEDSPPPGRGNFLIKVGGKPGIPLNVRLTDSEKAINDTNRRWHVASRAGGRAEAEVRA
jgi:hypothetical protein